MKIIFDKLKFYTMLDVFFKFLKLLYINNSLSWISLKKLKTQTQT